jgi:hypothetical protein
LLAEGGKNFEFEMGSSTAGEGWDVFGSNSTGVGTQLTALYVDGTDESLHTLPGGYLFYDFFYDGGAVAKGQGDNVLFTLFEADPGSSTPRVPEPSSWAMMLVGLAGLAVSSHRRARKAAREAQA